MYENTDCELCESNMCYTVIGNYYNNISLSYNVHEKTIFSEKLLCMPKNCRTLKMFV